MEDNKTRLATLSRGGNAVEGQPQKTIVEVVGITPEVAPCEVKGTQSSAVSAANLLGCSENIIPFNFKNNTDTKKYLVFGFAGKEGQFALLGIAGIENAADFPGVLCNGEANVRQLQAFNEMASTGQIIVNAFDFISPDNDEGVYSKNLQLINYSYDGSYKIGKAANAIASSIINGRNFKMAAVFGDPRFSWAFELGAGKEIDVNIYATASPVYNFEPFTGN